METEILINNTKIDLSEDLPISLNFSIADIREPDKRNTSYSKTINIPGSKTNNLLFSHIFKVEADINNTTTTNFNPDFNPNLKAACLVYQKKLLVFKGFARLMRITILDKYRINYEVSLFGDTANMFVELGEAKISNLDFSAYNHTYSKSNIRSSWTATPGYGYYYPMIDYGLSDLANWDVEDFKPAIYVKEVIDKMFAYAGFTYSSTFFDTTFFKSLILPFNSEALKLTETQVDNRHAKANTVVNNDYLMSTVANTTKTTIPFNTEITDTGGNYNNATYIYTAPANGLYKVDIDILSAIRYEPASSAFIGSIYNFAVYLDLVKQDVNGNIFPIQSLNPVNLTTGYLSPGTSVTTGQVTATSEIKLAQNIYLNTGEKVYARINPFVIQTSNFLFVDGSGAQIAGDIYYRIGTGSYVDVSIINNGLKEGETIPFNNVLPQDIKLKDFFVSIIRMFNLYVDLDKEISNRLLIEPRNDFYTSDYVDWSNKLDISQPFVISPMGALDARTYIFKYDDDGDYYNDTYKKIYEKNYGHREITVDNDFIKEKKESKLIFAPTPSVGQTWNDRVLPTIVKVDSNGNKVQKSSKLRILQRGGLKSCAPSWNFVSNSSGTSSESQYPYAGHLDDPYLSTTDINFGVPAEIFWSGDIYYTNNNLYNKYYKKFIEEITDKNSKIIAAKFYLNPNDISELDFRKKVFVNGLYYRLNSVKDYNPIVKNTTEVELIKIKEGTPFVATSGQVLGGYGEALDDNENLPLMKVSTGDSNNNGNLVIGTNYVHPTAKNVIVSGHDNTVGAYSDMVNILSSSGVVVGGGLSNVSVVNTSGVTITSSNTHYVNGVNTTNNSGGTYTPTITNRVNIDSITPQVTSYIRVGNIVHVGGAIVVNSTTTVTSSFEMSLPIASDFTSQYNLAGVGTNQSYEVAIIIASIANNTAVFTWIAADIDPVILTFNFTYRIL